MNGSEILARRPPLTTLAKAFAFINLGGWPVVGIYSIAASGLLKEEGGIFWFRIGFMVVMAALALWMLVLTLRVVSRWLLSRAGIYVGEGKLQFRIPVRRGWWNPFLKLDEEEVPFQAVRETGFNTATKAMLEIKLENETIRIPAGTFSEGGHEVETRIRGLAGLEVDESRKTWSISRKARVFAAIGGAVLVLATPIVLALFIKEMTEEIGGTAGSAMIFGMILLGFAMFHQGRFVLEKRGLFYERRGIVSHVSWKDLARDKAVVSGGEMFSSSLDVRSISSLFKHPACRIVLHRILGFGFPLDEIAKAIKEHV